MTAPLVFLDTETTGLSLNDDIWEVAAIRRDPDGTETELHLFVDHSTYRCEDLPEAFLADHLARFPLYHGERLPDTVKTQRQACELIRELFDGGVGGKPHVVGAVPNFDTERIARMCARNGIETPRWHYHLIDVENLAVGYLMGKGRFGSLVQPDPRVLPWNSDELAVALGVTITEAERHTAMGDARWAMRIYDAIMSGPVPEVTE